MSPAGGQIQKIPTTMMMYLLLRRKGTVDLMTMGLEIMSTQRTMRPHRTIQYGMGPLTMLETMLVSVDARMRVLDRLFMRSLQAASLTLLLRRDLLLSQMGTKDPITMGLKTTVTQRTCPHRTMQLGMGPLMMLETMLVSDDATMSL